MVNLLLTRPHLSVVVSCGIRNLATIAAVTTNCVLWIIARTPRAVTWASHAVVNATVTPLTAISLLQLAVEPDWLGPSAWRIALAAAALLAVAGQCHCGGACRPLSAGMTYAVASGLMPSPLARVLAALALLRPSLGKDQPGWCKPRTHTLPTQTSIAGQGKKQKEKGSCPPGRRSWQQPPVAASVQHRDQSPSRSRSRGRRLSRSRGRSQSRRPTPSPSPEPNSRAATASHHTRRPSWHKPPIASESELPPIASSGSRKACKHPAWRCPPAASDATPASSSSGRKSRSGSTWAQPCVAQVVASAWPGCKRRAQLTIGQVLLAAHRPQQECNSYAQAAMDRSNIQQALNKPVCKCKCGVGIPLCDLEAFCHLFRSMSRDDQCTYLASLKTEAGEVTGTVRPVTEWYLLGHRVCVERLCQLLHMCSGVLFPWVKAWWGWAPRGQ